MEDEARDSNDNAAAPDQPQQQQQQEQQVEVEEVDFTIQRDPGFSFAPAKHSSGPKISEEQLDEHAPISNATPLNQ